MDGNNKKKQHSSLLLKMLSIALCLSLVGTTAYAFTYETNDESNDSNGSSNTQINTSLDSSSSNSDVIDPSQNDIDATRARMQAEAEAAKAEAAKQAKIIEQEKNQTTQQINSMESQLDALKAEQKKITDKLNSVTGQKNEQIAIKESYQAQLNNVINQIYLLDEKMKLLEVKIKQSQEDISQKKKEIDSSILQVRDRILESYKSGYSSPLSVVLGADSYYDSLVRTRVIKQISEHDQKLMETLQVQRKQLEESQKNLEAEKAEYEADKEDCEANKAGLGEQIKKAQVEIENIAQLEAEYANNLSASKKKAQEMESDIASAYKQLEALMSSSATSQYTGGLMGWPLPGYSTISSGYGWRFNGSDFHTGVDITGSGCMGAPIVAATEGKVIKTNYAYTPGRGYGMYVMLDHGGGITTLYGHMSAISVQEGQTVSRGQQIGSVGSTGWSTGAHLHFEVRKDGNHLNPMGYLQG